MNREKCFKSLSYSLKDRLDERDLHVAELLDAANKRDIKNYAAAQRNKLKRALIRDFQCADSAAQLIGTRQMDRYRIDRFILPGAAGYDIPVNLYIPADIISSCYPAVIVPVGHWPAGKADINVQRLCAQLAQTGMIAVTYDPVNQGERCPVSPGEYLEIRKDLSEDMMSVNMHMLPGNLFYMLGENLGSLFAWEGKRVCDFLCTFSIVDKTRIGVTGQSGGGTQSLYIAALDDRIAACSPAQCLTKFAGHLLEYGVGDCEQSIISISRDDAFDYADYLWAIYPKPLMINAADNDFFRLDGVLELYKEIERLYKYTDNICQLKVAKGGHIMGTQSRQFVLDFFSGVFKIERAHEKLPEPIALEADELDCFSNKPVQAIAVAAQILESKIPRRATEHKEIVKRVSKLLSDVDLPAAVFTEGADGYFTLQAGAAGAEGYLCCRNDNDSGLFMFLGKVSDYIGQVQCTGSYIIINPFCIEHAGLKQVFGYDEETRLFNLGVMMGMTPAVVRCALIKKLLDILEKQGLNAGEITLAARKAAGIQALYTAAADERITKVVLHEVQDSLDAYFYDENLVLPETMILPGLSEICDLRQLADAMDAEVIWQ